MSKWLTIVSLVLVAAVIAASGCASLQRRPPPTLEQIVQMSKNGISSDEIIKELKETRAVYPLTGAQIAQLHEDGVADPVLDHLQQAYVNAVRWQERSHYENRFWGFGCFGCSYYRPWAGPHFYHPY